MSAFPTKTGICTLTEDSLELSREGWRGGLAAVLFGKNNSRYRLTLWLTAVGSLAAALFCLWLNNYLLLVFFLGFAGFYFFNLWKNRDISTDTVIPLANIQHAVYHKGVEGVSRPYFELSFVDINKKPRRRLVILPAAGNGGREAAQTAQYLLREKGIEVRL